MWRSVGALGVVASLGVFACADDGPGGQGRINPSPPPPTVPADVVVTVEPDPYYGYPETPYPPENRYQPAKAMLGKFLFWEEQLSADDTVSCGTCHRPAAGGSDPRSHTMAAALPGVDGVLGTDDDVHGSPGLLRCDAAGRRTGDRVQVTGRKAPTYFDTAFELQLFWDGRAECTHPACPSESGFEDPDNPGVFAIKRGGALENQAVGPPLSDVEMACEKASWSAIHAKLREAPPLRLASDLPADMAAFRDEHPGYPAMFAAVFGDAETSGPRDEINTRRIAFAIATYERSLRSDRTPWDLWNGGQTDALTPVQLWGFDLFTNKAKCASCHKPPTFADGQFHFTGFFEPSWDEGRVKLSGNSWHRGAMRSAILRNVGLREPSGLLHSGTGPGRDLDSIVRMYNRGGRKEVTSIAAVPIAVDVAERALTDQEIGAIIEFVRHGLTDPRAARELPPFDRPRLGSESRRGD